MRFSFVSALTEKTTISRGAKGTRWSIKGDKVHPWSRGTLATSATTIRENQRNIEQALGHQASDRDLPRGPGMVLDPVLDTAFMTSTHQLGRTGGSMVSLHCHNDRPERCRRDGGVGKAEGKAVAAIRSWEDSGIASQTSRQTLVTVRHKIVINEPSASSTQVDDLRPWHSRLKAAGVLLLLLVAYVVLWGPFFGLRLYRVVHGSASEPEAVELVALWLGFSTFAVNPFLYGWMNKAIREELLSFYRRFFRRWPFSACCPSTRNSCESLEDEMMQGPSDENFLQFLERTSHNYSTSTEPESKGNCSVQTARSKTNSLLKSHILQGQQLPEHRNKQCGFRLSDSQQNI